jgi:FLVCR family feline leukemia virus subgroup C receptor-related protein
LPFVGGLVSQVVVLLLIMKTRKFKLTTLLLILLGSLTIAATYFIIMMNKIVVVYFFTFLIGVFLSPVVPLMLELSCELVYPLSGSFAVGTLYAGATLFSALTA